MLACGGAENCGAKLPFFSLRSEPKFPARVKCGNNFICSIKMENLSNKKYKKLSKAELSQIVGGRKLEWIECVGYVDEATGAFVAEGTVRHYVTKIFNREVRTTGDDKAGDIGNC